MVMPKKVVFKLTPLSDFIEEICQGIGLIESAAQFILHRGGTAVSDNVVHLPAVFLQASPCGLVLLFARQLLLPPGHMVDPVQGSAALQTFLFLLELWVVRFQNAAGDVVAAGPSHCKKLLPLDVVHLSPHQVDYRGADTLHQPAVPLLHRILGQQVVVFVVARHEQGGIRLLFQPVQPVLVVGTFIPNTSKFTVMLNSS